MTHVSAPGDPGTKADALKLIRDRHGVSQSVARHIYQMASIYKKSEYRRLGAIERDRERNVKP